MDLQPEGAKRLLVFGMTDTIGGIERFVENYETYLRGQGITLDFVVAFPTMALEDVFLAHGSRVFHVPHFASRPLAYCSEVGEILAHGAYDGVYVNMLSAANILPILLAKRAGVGAIIAHAHNNGIPKSLVKKALHALNSSYVCRSATAFFACSPEAATWLFPKVGADRVKVIPNAIDTSAFAFSRSGRERVRGSLGIAADRFVMGNVGRFSEQKNQLFLLDILASLRFDGIACDLLLVGGGDASYQGRFESVVKERGLAEFVHVAGEVEDVPSYLDAMDVFVFPSLFEGFGTAALEAEASGLPTLVSSGASDDVLVTPRARKICIDDPSLWVAALEGMLTPALLDDEAARLEDGRLVAASPYSLSESGESFARAVWAAL